MELMIIKKEGSQEYKEYKEGNNIDRILLNRIKTK